MSLRDGNNISEQHEDTPGLLIHCEEDRTLRAVLVGMLAEMERQ